MRVLITGVTGYIGSHLARALLPSHEVYGLIREPLNRTYTGGFQDRLRLLYYDGGYGSVSEALTASRPEVVYHLASYYTGTHGAEDTPALIASNITLGAYLLEALSAQGDGALVYASTVMQHFQGAGYCPLNLYAATKKAFSDLIAYYTDAGLLRAATLILSDTYGPDDHRPKVLNLIKEAAKNGDPLALSDGGQDYDLVYIDDVIRAFCQTGERLAADAGWKNEVFQVSPKNPLTLRETAERMLSLNGLSLRAAWGERPRPVREMRGAVRLYPPLPGWEPVVPLDEGLKRFCRM